MSPVYPVLFAAAGMALLALIVRWANELRRSASLKRHRSTALGFADLLNYAVLVADGVVLGKNGALIAGWRYAAPDDVGASFEERKALAARINEALSPLGSGWVIHCDCVRRASTVYPPEGRSHFPDPVTASIDQERRRLFEGDGNLFETEFALTVAYLPPLKVIRQMGEWLYDDDRPKRGALEEAQSVLERFQRDADALEDRLSSVFDLQRLKSRTETDEAGEPVVFDDLLSHLRRCATGFDYPVRLPRTPMLLDALIGSQELWRDLNPQVGQKHVQAVAIDGFPSESHPGILRALAELPIECRWNTRFIPLDRVEADTHLERIRRKWDQLVVPFLSKIFQIQTKNVNRHAALMAEDAHVAKAVIDSQEVTAGFYTANVILMHEDLEALAEAARYVQRTLHQVGFTPRLETINNLDAFLGSLPGHGFENVRRPLMHSLNLADLMPSSGVWTGLDVCPCPLYPADSPPLLCGVTDGANPFCFNLHVDDVGHTFVGGPTGSGKSTALNAIVASHRRYPGSTAYVFDKGWSSYALCKAAGGQHHVIGASGSSGLSFCPLGHLDSPEDLGWAQGWLEKVLALNGESVNAVQANEILDALKNMSQRGHRSLSAFCSTVQNPDVQRRLRDYTVSGTWGQLFDAEDEGLGGLGQLAVFETEELLGLGDKVVLPALWHLFRRIQKSLKGQPALLVIDEAWTALGHEVFREQIRQWLKEMRKANCAVLLATQSLSDALNCGIADVLAQECFTKIFLANANARNDADAYRAFGLIDRQIELIASSVPKRNYYAVSPVGCRRFSLALGPLALAFVGVSSKGDVAEIRRLEGSLGSGWVDAWLARRGLSLSDYLPAETHPPINLAA